MIFFDKTRDSYLLGSPAHRRELAHPAAMCQFGPAGSDVAWPVVADGWSHQTAVDAQLAPPTQCAPRSPSGHKWRLLRSPACACGCSRSRCTDMMS